MCVSVCVLVFIHVHEYTFDISTKLRLAVSEGASFSTPYASGEINAGHIRRKKKNDLMMAEVCSGKAACV